MTLRFDFDLPHEFVAQKHAKLEDIGDAVLTRKNHEMA
jgi:hypothetical protein